MKKIVFSILSLLLGLSVNAQIVPDGFYRVQNVNTGRYVTVTDDYGKVDYQATSADVGAIVTYKTKGEAQWDATRVISNPGSIIYAVGDGNNGYRLQCQGADTYNMVGAFLNVEKKSGGYVMSATKSGLRKYLFELTRAGMDSSEVVVESSNYDKGTLYWNVLPISTSGDNYFGMYPTIQKDNDYYLSFFAGFQFSFASSGMKAYYINKVDNSLKVAVWTEVTGDVPAAMPIIAKCASQSPADNRLDIHTGSASAPADNLLKGVYFCSVRNQASNPHNDFVLNDPETMRVLGVLSDGSLGMKVYGGQYIPKNSAYLQVEPGTAVELKLVTPEEYEELTKVVAVESVTFDTHEASLPIGATLQLNATVLPDNASNKELTWTSSDATIATVTQTGLVTTLKKGDVFITAMAKDGSKKFDKCQITVYSQYAESITLNTTTAKMKVGETLQLQATVLPETTENKNVTWKSSNTSVATVNASGLVTAVKAGNVKITATTQDGSALSAECNITVDNDTPPVTLLPGDANDDKLIDVADITTIAAYILGKNPEPFNAANADANQDTFIDVADITTVAAMILQK